MKLLKSSLIRNIVIIVKGGGMTIECYGGPPLEVRCKECDGDGIIDLTSVELCSEILRVFNDYTGKFGKPLKTENCGGVKSSEFHLADEKEGEYWIAPHYLNKCFLDIKYYRNEIHFLISETIEAIPKPFKIIKNPKEIFEETLQVVNQYIEKRLR